MLQQGMLTEMTHLALPTAWNACRQSEPAHLNSVVNLIPPTDRPTNCPHTLGGYYGPTIAGGRAGRWVQEAD